MIDKTTLQSGFNLLKKVSFNQSKLLFFQKKKYLNEKKIFGIIETFLIFSSTVWILLSIYHLNFSDLNKTHHGQPFGKEYVIGKQVFGQWCFLMKMQPEIQNGKYFVSGNKIYMKSCLKTKPFWMVPERLVNECC